MTTDQDLDRLLDRWFEEREVKAHGRVIDVVVGRIEHQRQRPAWPVSRRDTHVNGSIKSLAAIAAVIVVALVGYNLLPGRSTQGGIPSPASTASPSPAATPRETPAPSLRAYDWPRALTPGTYRTLLIWDIPFELQFTVPEGWQSRDVEVVRDSTLAVGFHLAGNTYSDPCAMVETDPATGPTVDDLAAALAALPEFDATAPASVGAGGNDGRYLELNVRSDASCEAPGLWSFPPDSYNGAGPMGPPWWGAELPNMRMWILDVSGVRLVVSGLWSDAATAADLAQLQAVLDSVRIVPATGPAIALPAP
jgi:hypothetical protein